MKPGGSGRTPLWRYKKSKGEKVSEEDLKVFFQGFVDRGVMSKWAVPDRIVVVESIPRTSVGKVDKKEIRKTVKSASPLSGFAGGKFLCICRALTGVVQNWSRYNAGTRVQR